MSYIYRVFLDEFAQAPPLRNSLDAGHPYRVPSVNCPSCGIWGAGEFVYPSVDVSSFDADTRRKIVKIGDSGRCQAIAVDAFAAYAAKLEMVLGSNRPIEPGTCFGPLSGDGSGDYYDFMWTTNAVVVKEHVFRRLCHEGFELLGVTAEIDRPDAPHELLIELEAPPLARYASNLSVKRCGVCGRNLSKRLPLCDLAISAGSFNEEIPLQRVRDWPPYLVVSQELGNAIKDYEFSGVSMHPVELSS